MNIRVLFFAQLKDRFGESERMVNVNEGITVGRLSKQLLQESGLSQYESLPIRYAVNERFVEPGVEIHDEDVVALIPPVAGG